MKPGIGRVCLKVPVIIAGLTMLSLGASVVLTDPDPASLPRRACRWFAARPWLSPAPAPGSRPGTDRKPRADWDDGFDDSGYATAIRFSKPITDPASLANIRDSVIGRGARAIAYLNDKLAGLSPANSATPSTSADIHVLLGSLMMHEGRWAEAGEHFAAAQTVDSARSARFRAKIEALRGVAALRRGEIENCVACCNESSCIFPLAAAAIHRAPPVHGKRSSISRAICGKSRMTWASNGS